jgi:hypothetical protein
VHLVEFGLTKIKPNPMLAWFDHGQTEPNIGLVSWISSDISWETLKIWLKVTS